MYNVHKHPSLEAMLMKSLDDREKKERKIINRYIYFAQLYPLSSRGHFANCVAVLFVMAAIRSSSA